MFLKDTQLPIWASLRAARAELHRDIHAVYLGHSQYLARLLAGSAVPAGTLLNF